MDEHPIAPHDDLTTEESTQDSGRTPRQKRRRRIRIALIAIAAVLVVAVAGTALFVFGLAQTFNNDRTVIAQAFPSNRAPAATGTAANAENILLLGSDTRGSAPSSLAAIRAQRSDTMILIHIPADRKHVYVMSIMRDSWVDIPGHGKAKINAALSWGGVPLTVETVEHLLGVRIDHVAIVSFSGFIGLTDALGGVTVNNPITFDSEGNHFAKGDITLDGVRALSFVRARYPFVDGDYQRVRDERLFLFGVLDRALSAETALNPVRTMQVVGAISPYVLTDSGLDAATIGSLAVSLRDVRTRDIVQFTAPTAGTGMEGDQSVVYLDPTGIQELSQDLKNDNLAAYDACQVDVC